MQIRASEFGISPEHDITEKLTKLFAYAKDIDGEKTVIFENMFKHSLSSSTDSILDVNFVNKGTSLVVTYILKEYDGEVTEVI